MKGIRFKQERCAFRFTETHGSGPGGPGVPVHTVVMECDSSRGHRDRHVYKIVERSPECLLRG